MIYPTTGDSDMLELKNLAFSVDGEEGKKEILKDISLTVEDGTFLVITGPMILLKELFYLLRSFCLYNNYNIV